jgi:hypothetical protein
MSPLLTLLILLCMLCIYVTPFLIALNRRHRNRIPILLVTLFFGWSILGWLVAFIWAFTSNVEAAQESGARQPASALFAGSWGICTFVLTSFISLVIATIGCEIVKSLLGLSYPYPLLLQWPIRLIFCFGAGGFLGALIASHIHGAAGWYWGASFGLLSGAAVVSSLLGLAMFGGGGLIAWSGGAIEVLLGLAGGRLGNRTTVSNKSRSAAVASPPDQPILGADFISRPP